MQASTPIDFDIFDDDRYEYCDVCERKLDKTKGEDFYIEETNSVYCAGHWRQRAGGFSE